MGKGHFTAFVFDLSAAAARGEKLKRPVDMPSPDATDDVARAQDLRLFRSWLMKTPRSFQAKLRLSATIKGEQGEIQIELRWVAAGDTAGVAFWSNADHTVAATVLLNGLETHEDLVRVDRVLAERGLAISPAARKAIGAQGPRPLMAVLFYSRGAMTFGPLLNVMPLFARTFFDQFGTTEQEEQPGGAT